MKQRIKKAGIYLIAAIIIGYTYAIFVNVTGWAIPCVFHRITGLKCPGCGVTRMCLAIIRFDIAEAFRSNQMLFILLPVLLIIFGNYTIGYIKTGRWFLSKGYTALTYICIGLLLLYAVYRNVYVV